MEMGTTGTSNTMFMVINGKERLCGFEEVLKNLIRETFELREANKGLKADIENLRCRIAELEENHEPTWGTCE